MSTKNKAIQEYLIAQSKASGKGKTPVILLPNFVEDNGTWIPEQSNGMRPTKNGEVSYIRLGQVVVKEGELGYLYTNTFKDTTKLEQYLEFNDLRIGDVVAGKLIVHESLTPFNTKNPDRDIKMSDSSANAVACTFQGELDDKVYDTPVNIYRRVEWTTDVNATDITIKHTNGAEISMWASAQRNKANTSALRNAAPVTVK